MSPGFQLLLMIATLGIRFWHKVTSKPRRFKAVIQMLVECTMQQFA